MLSCIHYKEENKEFVKYPRGSEQFESLLKPVRDSFYECYEMYDFRIQFVKNNMSIYRENSEWADVTVDYKGNLECYIFKGIINFEKYQLVYFKSMPSDSINREREICHLVIHKEHLIGIEWESWVNEEGESMYRFIYTDDEYKKYDFLNIDDIWETPKRVLGRKEKDVFIDEYNSIVICEEELRNDCEEQHIVFNGKYINGKRVAQNPVCLLKKVCRCKRYSYLIEEEDDPDDYRVKGFLCIYDEVNRKYIKKLSLFSISISVF